MRKKPEEIVPENNIRKSQQQGYRLLKLIIGGTVLIFIVSIFIDRPDNKNNKAESGSTTSEIVSNSASDGSVYQVKNYLKNILKDPDSFEAIEWSPVQNTDTGYMVQCKYRAKKNHMADM